MDTSERRRKSLRLPAYDYATPGAYFVTICTEHRATLFGAIVDDAMQLNAAGRMIADCWRRLPTKFRDIDLSDFVVMPNHLHGIAWIRVRETVEPVMSLPATIDWFKTMTTNEYIRGVRDCGWPRFDGRLWQRSYHERVIRNERELAAVTKYIIDNPLKWALDAENPDRVAVR